MFSIRLIKYAIRTKPLSINKKPYNYFTSFPKGKEVNYNYFRTFSTKNEIDTLFESDKNDNFSLIFSLVILRCAIKSHWRSAWPFTPLQFHWQSCCFPKRKIDWIFLPFINFDAGA